MKKLPLVLISVLLAFPLAAATRSQNGNSNSNASSSNSRKGARNRGPIFRATGDQIKQAQTILKRRGFYNGDQTGKLNPDTRAGLKKYQQAEGLKVTGTLNKATLEKMSIALIEKQRTM